MYVYHYTFQELDSWILEWYYIAIDKFRSKCCISLSLDKLDES